MVRWVRLNANILITTTAQPAYLTFPLPTKSGREISERDQHNRSQWVLGLSGGKVFKRWATRVYGGKPKQHTHARACACAHTHTHIITCKDPSQSLLFVHAASTHSTHSPPSLTIRSPHTPTHSARTGHIWSTMVLRPSTILRMTARTGNEESVTY